ncbi:hypothetical protein E0500_026940 [Streptomyces sp. KM273126]|uniref:hypothetical protein n=1 Tax=Streptomyces sp. KM273126 TaxID=2545247 RepID=UPI0010405B5E|nr:hypothetical protein [Streptomyces sp. KM273126]MBA2810936.1 hypothetical protein [Streptomyces sp. KM273126]
MKSRIAAAPRVHIGQVCVMRPAVVPKPDLNLIVVGADVLDVLAWWEWPHLSGPRGAASSTIGPVRFRMTGR